MYDNSVNHILKWEAALSRPTHVCSDPGELELGSVCIHEINKLLDVVFGCATTVGHIAHQVLYPGELKSTCGQKCAFIGI